MLRRAYWSVPVVVLVVMGGAACAGDERGHKRAAPRPPAIQVIPANGTPDARPDRPVVVTAERGTLHQVVVREDPRAHLRPKGTLPLPGRFSEDRRTWRALGTLRPHTAYTVTATGTGPGGERTWHASRFTTLRPRATFAVADVTPRPGEVVGVGMPLIVTFDRPIARRAAVERSLEVRMSRPVTGAWNWTTAQQVVFRPRRYWPTGQRVTLLARTTGVRAAPGVYGTSDHTSRFRVGTRRVSTVDVRRHVMSVEENGVLVNTAPISAGKGGRRAYVTTSGVHLAMGKYDPVIMTSAWMGVTDRDDPRYYKKTVRHAVQISGTGEYVHAAPWSVASQGRANVSHGCVNASPTFAQWFYARTQRGDIVKVTGTDRPLEPFNGWGYWQMPWERWVKGGALNRPVLPREHDP